MPRVQCMWGVLQKQTFRTSTFTHTNLHPHHRSPAMFRRFCLTMICCLSLCSATTNAQQPTDTKPLTSEGDLASQMVDGIDRFLLQQIADAPQHRAAFWNRDTTSVEAYQTSLADNRKRLANILGARDSRIAFDAPELIATTNHDSLIADTPAYTIYAVRWPVLADPAPTAQHLTSLHGAGLLLVPKLEVGKVIGNVVAIPHAGHSPEQLCGLAPGILRNLNTRDDWPKAAAA